MSIYDDIAGAVAVTIPEGSVVKITRKSDGVVVWEQPLLSVKVYIVDEGNLGYSNVTILGNTYTTDGYVEVPIGTEALCWAKNPGVHDYSSGVITDEDLGEILAETDIGTNNQEVQASITIIKDTVFRLLQLTGVSWVKVVSKENYESNYGPLPDYS